MGSHFASPFATIAIHYVESSALDSIRNNFDFSPIIYKRYLDDILLGPIDSFEFAQNILSTFNSVNASIQFTLDYPKADSPISFLDIELRVKRKDIEYWWFVKPTHSNITLRKDSWVPNHVKHNFIKSSCTNVSNRCSSEELRDKSIRKLNDRLSKNGFRDIKPTRKINRKNNDKKKNSIKLDFVSDRLSRQITNIINKYDFSVRLVNKPAKNLKTLLNNRTTKIEKHRNCDPCKQLPDSFNCDIKYVVYKFICKRCHKSYIGETCRPFYFRYREHRNSIKSKDCKSALSQHILANHQNEDLFLTDFDLQIVAKCRSPVETRMTEAREISAHRDLINRKHKIY